MSEVILFMNGFWVGAMAMWLFDYFCCESQRRAKPKMEYPPPIHANCKCYIAPLDIMEDPTIKESLKVAEIEESEQ